MSFYDLAPATAEHEAAVRRALVGFDLVSRDLAGRIAQAWAVAWANSTFGRFDAIPTSPSLPDVPLVSHVNAVTTAALALASVSRDTWGIAVDGEIVVASAMLHDVDKPLLFEADRGRIRRSTVAGHLPHGVLGAMILKDLGLPDLVVSIVATHATDAPFHGDTAEARVLHYADMFAIDSALAEAGRQPFYLRPR